MRGHPEICLKGLEGIEEAQSGQQVSFPRYGLGISTVTSKGVFIIPT
jgi:hypothetical protein